MPRCARARGNDAETILDEDGSGAADLWRCEMDGVQTGFSIFGI